MRVAVAIPASVRRLVERDDRTFCESCGFPLGEAVRERVTACPLCRTPLEAHRGPRSNPK